MKKNIGIEDKRVRLTLGVIFLGLGVYFHSWWGIFGLPLLLTGWMKMCPLYTIVGISTDKKSEETCPVPPAPEKKEDQTDNAPRSL